MGTSWISRKGGILEKGGMTPLTNYDHRVISCRKQNGQVLAILRVFDLHQNGKSLDILYLNKFKIINSELLQV